MKNKSQEVVSKVSKNYDKQYFGKEKLPSKVFQPRASILTDLLHSDENIKALYNISVMLTIGYISSTAIINYRNEKRFYVLPKRMDEIFVNFDWAFVMWIFLFLSSMGVYWGFIFWASIRNRVNSKVWDGLWSVLHATYYPLVLYYSTQYVITFKLGFVASFALAIETTRFLMKTYAFVRSNIPKYLQKNEKPLHPTFSHYLYFSFAPVLVYKDSYPRSNEKIRWKYVFRMLSEALIALLFIVILYDNTYTYYLNEYGLKPYSFFDVLLISMLCIPIANIYLIVFFYAVIHCYPNATSEILGFSDRLFYKNWWTAPTFDVYLNKWNVFVHDWLYTYLYKDFYIHVFPENKMMARLITFTVSGIFHDYIIYIISGALLPMFTMSYIFLVFLLEFSSYANVKTNNLVFWICADILASGVFTFASAEYHAKVNCPKELVTISDYIIPRLFSC